MNGIQFALRRAHGGESQIGSDLLQVAERHRAEHEIHHVTRDLASWSIKHVALIAEHASRVDLDLDLDIDSPPSAASRLRESLPTALDRRPHPGILLLDDLRGLYLQASDNSLAWEMLAQIAQAKHEPDLLTLTQRCHPQTLRQIRWANTMIKTQTPQLLASL
jgi:hypothetical protein